jgi:hypothetical protein
MTFSPSLNKCAPQRPKRVETIKTEWDVGSAGNDNSRIWKFVNMKTLSPREILICLTRDLPSKISSHVPDGRLDIE